MKLGQAWAVVIAALIGVVGVGIIGCFEIRQTQIPNKATQTAEAKQRPLVSPVITTQNSIASPAKVWMYKDMIVGFIPLGSESAWGTANTASFKETAQQLGINLRFYDASSGPVKKYQIAAFRNFIADKEINVIILTAFEATGWDDMLKEAKSAGKTVILQDRGIDASKDLYATYVGFDFVEQGRKAAIEMCKLLESSAKKNVVELVGGDGYSASRDRGVGFREKMGDCGITITQSETADWDIKRGKQVMESFLMKSRDIQGVFAQNDAMALGAIQSLKEVGMKPASDVKIVSVDATADAFKAMIAGDLNVTVECNPLLAPQVYEVALKALNGEILPKWIPAQESVFYAKDAASILPTRKY